jgi:uncharacterized membrane protein
MSGNHKVVVPPRHAKLTRENLTESFHLNLHVSRDWTDAFADWMTKQFGTVHFLIFNGALFLIWIVINLETFGLHAFDPFPFGLLTLAVSLEAIFLSVVVLISQNRQSRVADIRQQMDFEIDVRAEEEITKMLAILDQLRKAAGIQGSDPELKRMMKELDLDQMQRDAERDTQ